MVQIRMEHKSDYEKVFQLNYEAFGNREDESKLIERIRLSEGFISELSLVAEEQGQIVGHVLLSKAEVVNGDNRQEVIVLAPIAVRPSHQKQGIGSSLIQAGLQCCEELGYIYVFLIGHPSYYPKFGFKPARAYGFELMQFQVPDDVFMVCELKQVASGHPIKGELVYPQPFLG